LAVERPDILSGLSIAVSPTAKLHGDWAASVPPGERTSCPAFLQGLGGIRAAWGADILSGLSI